MAVHEMCKEVVVNRPSKGGRLNGLDSGFFFGRSPNRATGKVGVHREWPRPFLGSPPCGRGDEFKVLGLGLRDIIPKMHTESLLVIVPIIHAFIPY